MRGSQTDGLTRVCTEMHESHGEVSVRVLRKGNRCFQNSMKSLLRSMTNEGSGTLAAISKEHLVSGGALGAALRALKPDVDFALRSGHSLFSPHWLDNFHG